MEIIERRGGFDWVVKDDKGKIVAQGGKVFGDRHAAERHFKRRMEGRASGYGMTMQVGEPQKKKTAKKGRK